MIDTTTNPALAPAESPEVIAQREAFITARAQQTAAALAFAKQRIADANQQFDSIASSG